MIIDNEYLIFMRSCNWFVGKSRGKLIFLQIYLPNIVN
jgi:hypothetical protein